MFGLAPYPHSNPSELCGAGQSLAGSFDVLGLHGPVLGPINLVQQGRSS